MMRENENFFLVAERASLLPYSSLCTISVPRISEPEPGKYVACNGQWQEINVNNQLTFNRAQRF